MEDTTIIEEEELASTTPQGVQPGIFKHTFLEMWEIALQNSIEVTEEPLTLDVATAILTAYSWLDHSQLHGYRAGRARRLREALDLLNENLGKKKEQIYKETDDDWALHQDIYIQVLIDWRDLLERWSQEWSTQAAKNPDPVQHAVIADVAGILLNPQYGLSEGLRNLAGFELTAELRAKLNPESGGDDE